MIYGTTAIIIIIIVAVFLKMLK